MRRSSWLALLISAGMLLPACADDLDRSAPTTAAATSTVPHSPYVCVTGGEAANEAAPVRMTVTPGDACTPRAGASGIVTVLNDGPSECHSDIMTTTSPNLGMWFHSTSGQGGETGWWEPLPEGTEGVGTMDYPVGSRSWSVILPTATPSESTFYLSISCDGKLVNLAAPFRSEVR